MKKSANRNQFEAAVEGVWEAYAAHLSGSPSSLLCAVSLGPLDESGRKALESSCVALGFGTKGCCFVSLRDASNNHGGSSVDAADVGTTARSAEASNATSAADVADAAHATGAAVAVGAAVASHAAGAAGDAVAAVADTTATLGTFDLRTLIEACDPLALVACDAASAQLISRTYNAEVAPGRANRVMGRTCVAFADLESLLQTPADKQKAWHLLKQLTA